MKSTIRTYTNVGYYERIGRRQTLVLCQPEAQYIPKSYSPMYQHPQKGNLGAEEQMYETPSSMALITSITEEGKDE